MGRVDVLDYDVFVFLCDVLIQDDTGRIQCRSDSDMDAVSSRVSLIPGCRSKETWVRWFINARLNVALPM